MSTRKSNPKRLEINGIPYIYWVRELPYDDTGAVPLSVVIRADFGTRSTCTFTGLKNRERWHDYPNWNQELAIAVTPKVVCDLVHFAHGAGWDPSGVRANLTLEIENSLLSRPSPPEINKKDA
jgi:hypothetical protein